MKSPKNMILTVLMIVMCACSSSETDPNPALTPEEKQIEMLARTWIPGTVYYGGENITDRFENFALTFTKDKKYKADGKLGDFDYEPFKVSGTWNFHDQDLKAVGRDDGVVMATVVTDGTLTLTFTVTEENGRRAGLGEYKFDLIPR